MAIRSYADVPNRVVRLFLQEAGRHYDLNRDLRPFRSMTDALKDRFDGRCAYCGAQVALVAEHLVPMNRKSVGLHAWGNIVPACKPCNDIKAGHAWGAHSQLDDARRGAIDTYISEYRYAPDVTGLQLVLEKLYELTNLQTRALVEFGLVASQPHIAGLHTAIPGEPLSPALEIDEDGSEPDSV
jgi:HNH endonuclease